MKKYTTVPAITGKQLIKLLKKDGWTIWGKSRHGMLLKKWVGDRNLVTVVQNTSSSLAKGTLGDILGPQQTRLSKKGLLKLINEYGL